VTGTTAWLTVLNAARSARAHWLSALAAAGSAEALTAETPARLATLGITDAEARELKAPDRAAIDRWRKWLDQPGRALVTFGSELYPPLLAAIPDPPLALWTEGSRRDLLAAPQLAIVGSRSPTIGGRETAEQFARYLSENGLTITSGLAVGIDGASHRGGLDGVGKTIAVLGSGIDVIFPRAHGDLAKRIAAEGLLVSEYAPGAAPQKFHFPQRNRIIAGLSVGTLVVEAGRRSGSLITARHATDFGREVFAIPGSIHNALARGCHSLIRNGAKLVEEAGDIFEELAALLQLERLPPRAPRTTTNKSALLDDPDYANVLNALDYAPTPIALLIERAGLTAAELSSMLLVLELEGFVEALPGGRYARLAPRGQ
jgi:DNA processing protein